MIAMFLALALAGAEPMSTAPEPDVIANPQWKSVPTGEDMSRFYPSGGQGGVSRVVVICQVGKYGWLTNCKAETADPAGVGFEESGVKLAKKFQLAPVDKDGAPTTGRLVRLPLVWSVPPKPR